jgi:RNA polymerase sigma factor (TIGR02999 family)
VSEVPCHDLTLLMQQASSGERVALEEFARQVYRGLRAIASDLLRHERPGHTLPPTALVNEAWIRLSGQLGGFENRKHFFVVAAKIMRRILVDHARKQCAQKRGGGEPVASCDGLEELVFVDHDPAEIIALHDVMDHLLTRNRRQGEVFLLWYFGGLSFKEIAALLEMSLAAVRADHLAARGWLHDRLSA